MGAITVDDGVRFRGFLLIYSFQKLSIIFLVTGPKPNLFPQVLTAFALHLTVSKKKIDLRNFVLICILIMGAAQHKLSFIITGGVIGFWALCKALPYSKGIIPCGLLLFIFFFVPRGIWNLQQLIEINLIGFITPLPETFTNYLRVYRGDNQLWFPFNLFIPSSFGALTTVLGFQVFLVILTKFSNPKFRETLIVTATSATLTYFLGQSIARSYYEFVLWTAVAFSFLSEKDFCFRLYNRFLAIQGICVLAMSTFAVCTLTPGVISKKWREEIMHRAAYEYSAAVWLNDVLPKDAVVLSELRSVALLERDFVPMDWLKFNLDWKKSYIYEIMNKNVNYIAIKGQAFENHPLFGCIGEKFKGPKSFVKATRNPFNRGQEYIVTIYKFHSNLIPVCVK